MCPNFELFKFSKKNIIFVFGILFFFSVLLLASVSQKTPGVSQVFPYIRISFFLMFGFVFLLSMFLAFKGYFVIKINILIFSYLIFLMSSAIPVLFYKWSINNYILFLSFYHLFPFLLLNFFKRFKKTDSKILKYYAIMCVFFCFIHAIIAFTSWIDDYFQLFNIETFHNSAWDDRLHGLLGEPTHFGLSQGLGAISLLYLYLISQEKKSLILNLSAITLFGFFVCMVFLSGTRNSMISLILSIFLFSILNKPIRDLILQLSIFLLPLAIYMIVTNLEISEIIRFQSNASNEIRILSLIEALNLIYDNMHILLFGLGFPKSVLTPTSFNFYIDHLRDYGILVFILSFMFILVSLNKLFIRYLNGKMEYVFPICMFAYMLISFLMYNPFRSVFHFEGFSFMFMIMFSFSLLKSKYLIIDFVLVYSVVNSYWSKVILNAKKFLF